MTGGVSKLICGSRNLVVNSVVNFSLLLVLKTLVGNGEFMVTVVRGLGAYLCYFDPRGSEGEEVLAGWCLVGLIG